MLLAGHLLKMPFLCGAGAVAEMTGRRGRVVADARGRGVYELRAKPDSTEMDSLNVSETGIRALCDANTFLYRWNNVFHAADRKLF